MNNSSTYARLQRFTQPPCIHASSLIQAKRLHHLHFPRASRYSTHHIQIPQGTQEKLTRKTPSLANSVARPLLITSSHTHSFTGKAQEKTPPLQSKSPTHKNAPITCPSHHQKICYLFTSITQKNSRYMSNPKHSRSVVGADVGDSPPAVSAPSLVSFPLQHHRGLFHFPRNRRPRLLV